MAQKNRWHHSGSKDFTGLGIELRRLDQVLNDGVVYDDKSATFTEPIVFSSNLTVGGTLSVSGNATLKGALSVVGAVVFSSNLTVGGTLSVSAGTTLLGTLSVAGAVVLSSTADVKGALSVSATAAFGVHLSTDATTGFVYVPTCSGTPTGVPVSVTGTAPIIIDRANNKLFFYSGGAWRDAGP